MDSIDDCPDDAYKQTPLKCGCNIPEIDSDNDGAPDCIDPCPHDPSPDCDGSLFNGSFNFGQTYEEESLAPTESAFEESHLSATFPEYTDSGSPPSPAFTRSPITNEPASTDEEFGSFPSYEGSYPSFRFGFESFIELH